MKLKFNSSKFHFGKIDENQVFNSDASLSPEVVAITPPSTKPPARDNTTKCHIAEKMKTRKTSTPRKECHDDTERWMSTSPTSSSPHDNTTRTSAEKACLRNHRHCSYDDHAHVDMLPHCGYNSRGEDIYHGNPSPIHTTDSSTPSGSSSSGSASRPPTRTPSDSSSTPSATDSIIYGEPVVGEAKKFMDDLWDACDKQDATKKKTINPPEATPAKDDTQDDDEDILVTEASPEDRNFNLTSPPKPKPHPLSRRPASRIQDSRPDHRPLAKVDDVERMDIQRGARRNPEDYPISNNTINEEVMEELKVTRYQCLHQTLTPLIRNFLLDNLRKTLRLDFPSFMAKDVALSTPSGTRIISGTNTYAEALKRGPEDEAEGDGGNPEEQGEQQKKVSQSIAICPTLSFHQVYLSFTGKGLSQLSPTPTDARETTNKILSTPTPTHPNLQSPITHHDDPGYRSYPNLGYPPHYHETFLSIQMTFVLIMYLCLSSSSLPPTFTILKSIFDINLFCARTNLLNLFCANLKSRNKSRHYIPSLLLTSQSSNLLSLSDPNLSSVSNQFLVFLTSMVLTTVCRVTKAMNVQLHQISDILMFNTYSSQKMLPTKLLDLLPNKQSHQTSEGKTYHQDYSNKTPKTNKDDYAVIDNILTRQFFVY